MAPTPNETPTETPPAPPGTSAADPFLLEVRRRWLPSEDDRRRRLVHQLCNLLDEPAGGLGAQQRRHAEALLGLTDAYTRDVSGRMRSLEAFRQDVIELRRRVWERFIDGGTPSTCPPASITLELEPFVREALDAAASAHCVSREQLIEVLLRGVAEGLRRPGTWARPHVEALLLKPLEHSARGPW